MKDEKGNMKGWKECKLGDIAEVIGGGTPSTSKKEYWNGDIPWLTPRDLTGYNRTYISKGERGISELGLKYSSTRILPEGSVLITSRAPIGYVALAENPICTNQGFKSLVLNRNIASNLFVYYWIKSNVEYLKSVGTGTTFEEISGSVVKDLDILLPPLPEQKAIAAVLSSLDDKIDLLHRQNKTLEAMAETLFRQWFVEEADEGWEEGKISDLCIVITKGTTPTTLGHQFTETGINFVKAESITDTGDFIWNKFAKISDETHIFLNRSILQEGDILCSIAGTIGRVAITTNDILPANTNQAIAILRVDNKKCFPEFIYLFMKSALFREIMDGKIVHAVQPNLSLGEIGNSTLKIPPFSYLMNFKNVVQPIFAKKNENYNQIRTLAKLRDTLLPKLMSGEVRVKV